MNCNHDNTTTLDLKAGVSHGTIKVGDEVVMTYYANVEKLHCKDCSRTLYLDNHTHKKWLYKQTLGVENIK